MGGDKVSQVTCGGAGNMEKQIMLPAEHEDVERFRQVAQSARELEHVRSGLSVDSDGDHRCDIKAEAAQVDIGVETANGARLPQGPDPVQAGRLCQDGTAGQQVVGVRASSESSRRMIISAASSRIGFG